MPLMSRREGKLVHDAPPMRRMMPHLMPGRNEAAVYFEQVVDLTKTLAYIDARNAGCGEKAVTLFQIVLAAMVRTMAARPELNRFVVGRRLYQRHDIEFSFAIKRAMRDDAGLTTAKVVFEPDDDLEAVGAKLRGDIHAGKSGKASQSDVEMGVLTRLPRFLLRFIMRCQQVLDYFGLLPYALIRKDPLYASMFFTNLGSVGLDSAYHHLYEYGTCPFFAAIGRVKKAVVPGPEGTPVVRDVVSLKFVFDERIADGLYCARSLELFKGYVEDPERLSAASPAPSRAPSPAVATPTP